MDSKEGVFWLFHLKSIIYRLALKLLWRRSIHVCHFFFRSSVLDFSTKVLWSFVMIYYSLRDPLQLAKLALSQKSWKRVPFWQLHRFYWEGKDVVGKKYTALYFSVAAFQNSMVELHTNKSMNFHFIAGGEKCSHVFPHVFIQCAWMTTSSALSS